MRASRIEADEKVKFAYSINIQRLVNPSLPMYVQLSAKDLIEKPIWETAELIKKSKSNVTDEYVRSYIDYQELHFGDGITAGNEVSGFTDWRHLGHSTVDFGWGGPVTVLPLGSNLLESVEPCFFLPYSTASKGKREGVQGFGEFERDCVACLQTRHESVLAVAKSNTYMYLSLVPILHHSF